MSRHHVSPIFRNVDGKKLRVKEQVRLSRYLAALQWTLFAMLQTRATLAIFRPVREGIYGSTVLFDPNH